jgi:hypothetical protein
MSRLWPSIPDHMSFQMPGVQTASNSAIMTPSGQRPHPGYQRADVPDKFIPVYVPGQCGGGTAQYRGTRGIQTLTGEIRQDCWLGRKTACVAHKRHNFTISAHDNHLMHELTFIIIIWFYWNSFPIRNKSNNLKNVPVNRRPRNACP